MSVTPFYLSLCLWTLLRRALRQKSEKLWVMDRCQHHNGASLGIDSYKWRSVSFYFCVMGTWQCFLNEGRGAANKSSRSNVAHSTALLSRSIVNVLCPDVLWGEKNQHGRYKLVPSNTHSVRYFLPKSTSWSGLRNGRDIERIEILFLSYRRCDWIQKKIQKYGNSRMKHQKTLEI